MPISFAAITPHPPLLIPTIGKELIKKIDKTKKAMEKLEEDLYLSKPEIIVIISPHGSFFQDAFALNSCNEYETDLREFGDLSVTNKYRGEFLLSSILREGSKDADYKTTMISEKKLDHGSSVPLFYLTKHLPGVPILPIGFCDLDWKTHFDFGYLIKEKINEINKRVAIIASGDLSHALSADAPAGYNPAGAKFDAKIQEMLNQNNLAGLLSIDKQLVDDASECGFRSLLILMGILKGMSYNYKSLSYEYPFGVGYLVANFYL